MSVLRAVVMAAVAVVVAAPASAGPGDPVDLSRRKYDEIQALVKKFPKKADLHQAIRGVMDTFVDFRELSRRALGTEWGKLKRREQDEFTGEFKKMIQRTYVKRFNAEKEVRIEYVGATTVDPDGTATVRSIVHSGRSEARVDYRFHRKGGAWWAFDVVIDDVSMVRNYGKQFHDILVRDGFKGLMERLRKKNERAEETDG